MLHDNDDLAMFVTIEDALIAIKANRIDPTRLGGFDAEGRRLAVAAHERDVAITVNADLDPDPAELKKRLRAYVNSDWLQQHGVVVPEDATLSELVRAVMIFHHGRGGPAGYGTQNLRGLRTRVGWERHGGRGVLRISATWIPWDRHQGRGRIELLPNGPELPK
ncbi:hypothetical protein [Salinibacterium sp. NYA9b]